MARPETIGVVVNGRARELPPNTRLGELVGEMGLDRRFLVVELNGEALARGEGMDRVLRSGDRLELVRPVAGG